MLKPIGLVAALLAGSMLYAQNVDLPGWNWPKDEDLKKQAIEKQAYYKVQMAMDNYDGALGTLMWLYEKVPNLNGSIYVDGAKVIDNILETNPSDARKAVLQDSALWMYDQRIQYFDDKSAALDRKAYTAFRFHYRTPARFPLVASIYEKLFQLSASEISDFNLTPYMTLATYYYKSKPAEMTGERVLDIHDRISTVIQEKMANGADAEKMQKEQDKVDAFLNSLDVLNCQYIAEKLVPKMTTEPNAAKKVFSYALKAKCIDEPWFLQAGEILYTSEPTYQLAKVLGDRSLKSDDLNKALEYYGKAETLAETTDQKYDIQMSKASIYAKQGLKAKARAAAYEALSVKPGAKEAFNLIGNLYYGSYNDCKQGTSKVRDRAVFLAAFEMYEKAGNTEQMAAAKEQFPSIEEIFSESMEEGQKITVDCWINETVVLRRR